MTTPAHFLWVLKLLCILHLFLAQALLTVSFLLARGPLRHAGCYGKACFLIATSPSPLLTHTFRELGGGRVSLALGHTFLRPNPSRKRDLF